MTKHVEQDHVSLFKQFKEKIVVHPWSHHDCEPTTKWQQVAPSSILGFSSSPNPFSKIMACKRGFYKMLCCS
jgi:hypothetical protein